MGGRWVSRRYRYISRSLPTDRLVTLGFSFAEARLILAKMEWNFEMELVDKDDWNRLDQKAHLNFEPKDLSVKLREKSL